MFFLFFFWNDTKNGNHNPFLVNRAPYQTNLTLEGPFSPGGPVRPPDPPPPGGPRGPGGPGSPGSPGSPYKSKREHESILKDFNVDIRKELTLVKVSR